MTFTDGHAAGKLVRINVNLNKRLKRYWPLTWKAETTFDDGQFVDRPPPFKSRFHLQTIKLRWHAESAMQRAEKASSGDERLYVAHFLNLALELRRYLARRQWRR